MCLSVIYTLYYVCVCVIVASAQQQGYDVVLVDTAGRMQDNEPLMRSLAKVTVFTYLSSSPPPLSLSLSKYMFACTRNYNIYMPGIKFEY